MEVIQFETPSMTRFERDSVIEGNFNVSWIRLWLFLPSFVLASLERTSTLTFAPLGTCRNTILENSFISSFTFIRYFWSNASLACYVPFT